MEKPTVRAVNSVPLTAPHLQVVDLTVSDVHGRRLLDRLSFAAASGERLAVIGASGAGKSLLALSLMGLLRPPLAVTHGAVWLQGRNLLALPRAERHAQRGTGMFLIFQSPGALLDPMLNIGHQLTQTAARADIAGPEQQKAISRALTDVSLPQTVLQQHAFALSGGMKQRVLIAMALLLKPSLLIADEPTAALDDDTAHEVLNALAFARQATDSMLLLITHDLRLARLYANRVLVLDGGSLVEDATLPTFLSGARSDAGRALLDASAYLRDEP